MSSSKVVSCLAAVAVLGLAWAGLAGAQEGERRQGRERLDPAQRRQRTMNRMRERLGASEEEWTVLGPLVEKVQDLQGEAGGGQGMRLLFGRRGGGRGEAAETPEEPQSEMSEATAALVQVLEAEDSAAEEVTAALTAYRAARDEVRQELAKAQEELREGLTARQEALLVLMGLMD